MRGNGALNGVVVDARIGDCYAPVLGERFDLVCTNAPQMPTPAHRARRDAAALADNGGADGGEMLDRVIEGARGHLRPGGRLVFTLFAFLGQKTAFAKLEAVGLTPSIIAREVESSPRIGYERLEHIRALDTEASVPAGQPETVERLVIQGVLTEGSADDPPPHRERGRLRSGAGSQRRNPGRAPARDRQQHDPPGHR